MDLGKSEIAMLSRFFRDENKLLLTSQGRLKQWLEQHFDLYHNGKGFVFTEQSKTRFRQEVELLYPRINMRQGLPSQQNRLEVVEFVNNDKLADIKPNDQYVLVTSQAAINVFARDVILAPTVSLRLPVDAIDIANLKSVIIVENQDVFDVWHQVKLDSKYQHSLVVYRGNDKSLAKGVKTLVAQLVQGTEVLLFADLDPKGLEMAYTIQGVTGLLAPSLEDIQTKLSVYSQESLFLRQLDSVTFLQKQQPQGWHQLQQLILKQRFAIMQQAILLLELKLKIFER
jgi:hypothetical protein